MKFMNESESRIIPCPVCKREIELWTAGPFGFDTGTCKHCWISIYSKDKDIVWLRYEKKNKRFKDVGPLFFHVGYPFELSFLVTDSLHAVPHKLLDTVFYRIKENNR